MHVVHSRPKFLPPRPPAAPLQRANIRRIMSAPKEPPARPDAPSSASSLSIYLRLLGYVRPFVGWFLVSLAGYAIFASSQPMLAGVLKYFVDGLTDPDAAIIRDLPLFDGMDLLYAAPLMIVVISAWR